MRSFILFQDAYHLKDWIEQDSASGISSQKLKDLFGAVDSLALCADLCNRTKHFRLDPNRRQWTGDPLTAFTGQDVTVRGAAAVPGQPGIGLSALHGWRVESGGRPPYDAVTLAGDVVQEWDNWLKAEGLIT